MVRAQRTTTRRIGSRLRTTPYYIFDDDMTVATARHVSAQQHRKLFNSTTFIANQTRWRFVSWRGRLGCACDVEFRTSVEEP